MRSRAAAIDGPFLEDGSRVAVVGGGPAGSFFSFFVRQMASRVGLDLSVDVYEPRDFAQPGPKGCNMCGGIISESLVQHLAAEGIRIPESVIHRRIDSYFLHLDVGSVRIETPLGQKRIAAVHRGGGPRGLTESRCASFDAFLLELAKAGGVRHVRERVDGIGFSDSRPQIHTQQGRQEQYDLVVGAVGINSPALKLFQACGVPAEPPRSTKAYICEFYLGQDLITRYLGDSMHVFLLNIPRLEFAALIPKSDYVTVCLLGRDIDPPLVDRFLRSPQVREHMPPHWEVPRDFCHCSPRLNVGSAVRPFADRMVLVGDCAVTRLFKDGIGAAYRASKAAAVTAVFEGVGESHFRRHYWPACQAINRDNTLGRVIFTATSQMQKRRYLQLGIWRMTAEEQLLEGGRRSMSTVLWDTFTGSAPYREILNRTVRPSFVAKFLQDTAAANLVFKNRARRRRLAMETGGLGKAYKDGEIIYHQGELGQCMYVVQTGEVQVTQRRGDQEFCLAVLGPGEFFGEAALFQKDVRNSTVRSAGKATILTLEKRTLLRRMHQEPSFGFVLLQRMSLRVRALETALIGAGSRLNEGVPEILDGTPAAVGPTRAAAKDTVAHASSAPQ